MSDLFNNPMVRKLKQDIPEEKQEELRIQGEVVYNNMEQMQDTSYLYDTAAYILVGLKSGLMIKDLSPEEINVLKEVYGPEEWKNKILSVIKRH